MDLVYLRVGRRAPENNSEGFYFGHRMADKNIQAVTNRHFSTESKIFLVLCKCEMDKLYSNVCAIQDHGTQVCILK